MKLESETKQDVAPLCFLGVIFSWNMLR